MVPTMLLKTPEAARALGISRTGVYRLVQEGRLKPLRIGRSVRFAAEDLQQFVRELRDNREME
jgi:excisionase family DNA binding protein